MNDILKYKHIKQMDRRNESSEGNTKANKAEKKNGKGKRGQEGNIKEDIKKEKGKRKES